MGFQLWYSENTGIRRNGTTFEEIQNIFIDSITTRYIYEPLACCSINDSPHEVKHTLEKRDFDLLGVINNEQKKIGFVEKEKLNHNEISASITEFHLDYVISESTPLSELFKILKTKNSVFVLNGDEINGIVTRADINKPVVRIYLFGVISLFEMNLNYWIKASYENDEWKGCLKGNRIEDAHKILEERKGNNLDLELLECLQFCDKREILKRNDGFLTKFEFESKAKFERLLKNVEKIRNELAHSQNSIIDNLKWDDFVNCIQQMQLFLEKSEKEIEK